MDVCSQLRGRGVGDSRANGNPQEFGEPGDDGMQGSGPSELARW